MEHASPRPRDPLRATLQASEASTGPRFHSRGKTWFITIFVVFVPLAWAIVLLWGVWRLALRQSGVSMGGPGDEWWKFRDFLPSRGPSRS